MPTGPRPRPPTRSVRCVFTGLHDGGPWAAVMWFYLPESGVVTHADLQSLASWSLDAYGANVIAHMSLACSVTKCELALYGSDLDLLLAEATAVHSGTVNGTNVPNQVALGISWSTGVSWRGGHPRTYVPGVLSEMMITYSKCTALTASTLAAGANTFHTNIESFTADSIPAVQHVCMSFVRGKEWRTPPVPIRITGATVDQRFDTQRRRLGRDI